MQRAGYVHRDLCSLPLFGGGRRIGLRRRGGKEVIDFLRNEEKARCLRSVETEEIEIKSGIEMRRSMIVIRRASGSLSQSRRSAVPSFSSSGFLFLMMISFPLDILVEVEAFFWYFLFGAIAGDGDGG